MIEQQIPSGDAYFSPCGHYRYSLTRTWRPNGPLLLFIMLNPSTADAERNDPTIRRCMGFARDWGFGRLAVANLYALRATQPKILWAAEDPIGSENDRMIEEAGMLADRTVVAWGAWPKAGDRVAQVLRLLPQQRLLCLGVTRDGHPRHPLYVPADRELQVFVR